MSELALAALREGGIDETLAVLQAAREWAESDDAQERQVLFTIVSDELRHAALAWRTVVWAVGSSEEQEDLRAQLLRLIDDEAHRVNNHQSAARRADFAAVIEPLAERLLRRVDVDWRTVVAAPDRPIEFDHGAVGARASFNLRDAAVAALLDTFTSL